MKDLTREHFESVLQELKTFVFEGKGRERHGNDLEFENQPWRFISDHVGPGFTTGQAMKKILELKNLSSIDAYKRELLGAISYLVMLYMYKEYTSKADIV